VGHRQSCLFLLAGDDLFDSQTRSLWHCVVSILSMTSWLCNIQHSYGQWPMVDFPSFWPPSLRGPFQPCLLGRSSDGSYCGRNPAPVGKHWVAMKQTIIKMIMG
jgi:hypothetical protein